MTPTTITTYVFYILLIIASGAGEYLHILPAGTFGTVIGGVLGFSIHSVATTSANNATLANVQATQQAGKSVP
jgi:hypothetical protein